MQIEKDEKSGRQGPGYEVMKSDMKDGDGR